MCVCEWGVFFLLANFFFDQLVYCDKNIREQQRTACESSLLRAAWYKKWKGKSDLCVMFQILFLNYFFLSHFDQDYCSSRVSVCVFFLSVGRVDTLVFFKALRNCLDKHAQYLHTTLCKTLLCWSCFDALSGFSYFTATPARGRRVISTHSFSLTWKNSWHFSTDADESVRESDRSNYHNATKLYVHFECARRWRNWKRNHKVVTRSTTVRPWSILTDTSGGKQYEIHTGHMLGEFLN